VLREHAPVLHLDAREPDRPRAVEDLVDLPLRGDRVALGPTRPGRDVAYGRVVRGTGGRRWLQYWFLYANNPQDRGIVRTGRHEGDWEMVQFTLSGDATFAQHNWAASCSWTGHVYVANGSHASYPDAGEHGRPWPDPDDEAPGDGAVVRPEIRRLGSWVRWPGRWGMSESHWWIPSEAPSPRGPAFQQSGVFEDPSGRDAEARPCAAGAPPHPWPVYAGLALATILLGFGAITLIPWKRKGSGGVAQA
jgi:hypothetical protein